MQRRQMVAGYPAPSKMTMEERVSGSSEEGRYMAIVEIERGGKRDQIVVHTLRDMLRGWAERLNDGTTVRADFENWTIYVRRPLTDHGLEDFLSKSLSSFAGKLPFNAIRIRYAPDSQGTQWGINTDGRRAEEIGLRYRAAVGENSILEAKVAELQAEVERLTAGNRRLEQDTLDVMGADEIVKTSLRAQVAGLEEKLEAAQATDVFRNALYHLSDAAERLAKAEPMIDELLRSEHALVQNALAKINALQLGQPVNSAEDAYAAIARFTNDDSGSILTETFARLNPEEVKVYIAAKKELGAINADLNKTTDYLNKLTEELQTDNTRKSLQSLLNDALKGITNDKKEQEDRITAYEQKANAFIESAKAELRSAEDELRQSEKQAQLKEGVRQAIGREGVPVYIALKDDGQNYMLTVHLPIRPNQKSATLDAMLCENMLTERVMGRIKKPDVEQIARSAEPQSGIKTYTITLPKKDYTPTDVTELRAGIEEAVMTRSQDSLLGKLGIPINIIFHSNIRFPQTEHEPEGCIEPDNNGIPPTVRALLEIFQTHPGVSYSSTRLDRLAGVGKRMARYYINSPYLKGFVEVTGNRSSTRYTYKQGGEAKDAQHTQAS